MAHPTDSIVFFDEATGKYKCEMRDKKIGRVWGVGYGNTRHEALINARRAQPPDGKIKRAIGWVQRHPFFAGAAVGVYLAARNGARTFGEYVAASVVGGVVGWVIGKVTRRLTR